MEVELQRIYPDDYTLPLVPAIKSYVIQPTNKKCTWVIIEFDDHISSSRRRVRKTPGPRLAAVVPPIKVSFPGYGHYRVIGTAGVGLGQTGEDGREGNGRWERERARGSHCVSGEGRNGIGLGRPERRGRKHRRTKISMNDLH